MVVKPAANLTRGSKGLVQPGLKVRGREYLRIIYGPDYTEPANLGPAAAARTRPQALDGAARVRPRARGARPGRPRRAALAGARVRVRRPGARIRTGGSAALNRNCRGPGSAGGASEENGRMNRLKSATSPYLLQHADNPVDWWPWSEEAFAEARRRDVPVLLSVGYAACHWCHVMAHESFEDPAVAAVVNEPRCRDQGGPGGAPRHRRRLHVGHPGDDRPGRLADDRVHDAGRRAVLLRHLLPAGPVRPARDRGGGVVEQRTRRESRASRNGSRPLWPRTLRRFPGWAARRAGSTWRR